MVDMVLLPFRTIDGLWRPDRDLPEGLHIVRDADEWASLWMQSASGRPSEPPVLAVNWTTEMCVVAAAGTRSSGGYVVLIDVIEVVDGHLRVLAWEIRPRPQLPNHASAHPSVPRCGGAGPAWRGHAGEAHRL